MNSTFCGLVSGRLAVPQLCEWEAAARPKGWGRHCKGALAGRRQEAGPGAHPSLMARA